MQTTPNTAIEQALIPSYFNLLSNGKNQMNLYRAEQNRGPDYNRMGRRRDINMFPDGSRLYKPKRDPQMLYQVEPFVSQQALYGAGLPDDATLRIARIISYSGTN